MQIINRIFLFLIISSHFYGYAIYVENDQTKSLGYGDWFINSDGELDLMKHLIHPGDIVFDVGANIGEWSEYALSLKREIHLYAFEPLPIIFSDLRKKFSEYPNVLVFQLAFSDQIGRENFYYYDETYEFSALSGFYEREVLKLDHQDPKAIEVTQNTISNFCSKHDIDKIDFLKIDAEGAEWIILKGAADYIKQNKIKAIQFEYGGCYIDAKITLEEIYNFLTDNDYKIYRIIPKGLVQIAKWDNSLENFNLCNYLAIKKDEIPNCLGK